MLLLRRNIRENDPFRNLRASPSFRSSLQVALPELGKAEKPEGPPWGRLLRFAATYGKWLDRSTRR